MFEQHPVMVHLCCNDPDNGLFAHRVAALEIGPNMHLVAADWYRPPRMRFLDNNKISISGMHFSITWYKQWYGNWCWDAVKMPGRDVVRLLNMIARRKNFDIEEGEHRLFNKFRSGSEWSDDDVRLISKDFEGLRT